MRFLSDSGHDGLPRSKEIISVRISDFRYLQEKLNLDHRWGHLTLANKTRETPAITYTRGARWAHLRVGSDDETIINWVFKISTVVTPD